MTLIVANILRKMSDIKIYNDDCLKILKDIPSESIDLILTDCPYRIVNGGCSNGEYNNHKNYGGGILNHRYENATRGKKGNYYVEGSKHISLCGILNDLDATTYTRQGKLFKHNDIKFSEWLPDVYRVLKKGTHCYIMINARNLKELQVEAEKVGFEFQQLCIWVKNNATPNRYYLNSCEYILMLSKRPARDINIMGTKNIFFIKNIIGNKNHPTQKPVELMKIMIQNSTKEGEKVLDPFMGTGATGIASKELNRDFIGIEIDEKYFKIAEERINGTKERKIIKQYEDTNIFDYL